MRSEILSPLSDDGRRAEAPVLLRAKVYIQAPRANGNANKASATKAVLVFYRTLLPENIPPYISSTLKPLDEIMGDYYRSYRC